MKKKFALSFVALASVALLAACGEVKSGASNTTGNPVDEKTIKIGFNFEETGAVAAYGTAEQKGAQLAVDEINAAGGIDGKQIEVVDKDNKSETAEAASVTTNLVTQSKVAAIVGPATSGATAAAVANATKAGVPLISPSAFDLPTQIGYDSDDVMAEGEVGKVGVAIDSLADMEILFDGIDLGKVSTSMTINAPASVLLAMYIAVAEKQGVPSTELKGTIQNDILKEYAARGTYIFPPKPSMRLITNIFEYCSQYVPKWNTISISGYHIREAGSTAAQEIAFTIADGIAYVEAALKAGLDVDTFAGRLSFFWNAHNNVLEEVAKFRASRRLWATIMKERFGAKKPKSMMLRVHTQTAGSMLTAQQVDNNIVRVALQTAAAVMGGTQSLHTNSRDEALALPTEASVQVALRTQQIVAYESGLADVVDPLGGSYYVEAMTNAIYDEAMAYIKKTIWTACANRWIPSVRNCISKRSTSPSA